jgi:DNA-directed RNA polymerase specialized sigma subunit
MSVATTIAPKTDMSIVAADLKQAADMIRIASKERARLIHVARYSGMTWQEIADACGLTQMGVMTIARNSNEGKLPVVPGSRPGQRTKVGP